MQKQLYKMLLSLYRGIISVCSIWTGVHRLRLLIRVFDYSHEFIQKGKKGALGCIFRCLVIVQVVIQYVKRIHGLEVTSIENVCLLTLDFRNILKLAVRDAANMHSFWNNR